MASDLAVLSDSEATDPNYQSNDYADLLINDSTNEVLESYHCFDRLYPASITKVMTALLTLEHGNMDDEITLKHDINLTENGAVISTLTKGDTVTVGQVFHTMLIKSANDCACLLYTSHHTVKRSSRRQRQCRLKDKSGGNKSIVQIFLFPPFV